MRTAKKALILLFLSCFFISLSAEETLILSSGQDNHPMYDRAEKIMTEVYARLGYSVVIRSSLTDRSFVEADIGKSDGLLFGGKKAGEDFKDLVMVPIPLGVDEIVAFSTDPSINIYRPENLTAYSVGIISGMKEAEKLTEQADRDPTADPIRMMRKLAAGRNDLVVTSKALGERVIERTGLQGIYIVSPPLASVEIYHFLNRKHADLVPRVAEILPAVIEDLYGTDE